MRHVYHCPMRWADLDLLGHVNNVVYVDYLQEARVDMLRSHGRAQRTSDLAEGVVVVSHQVTYVSPLRYGSRPVGIECWVTEIRAASFTLAYELFHDDPDTGDRTVYLRATTVLTPYLFVEERPRRLDPVERAVLAEYLEPAEPTPRLPFQPTRQLAGGHYPVQVRFSDVDVYGHVNNVKYFEYIQEARIKLTAHLWRDVPPGTPRTNFVVAQTDVDYRAPILFRPEPYDCWTWVRHVGERSLVLESEIRDAAEGGRVLARARVAVVFFDLDTGRSTVPEAAYREPLLAALAG